MEPLKFGIIGCGMAAEFHTLGIKNVENPNFKFTAAFDINPKKLKRFARRKKVTAYNSLDEMLNSDIDAVCIFLPHFLHCSIMKQAAQAGKHVLCEKPMANTLEECDEMIKAAKNANIKFMIAENHRFIPVHQKIKEYVSNGYIGDIFLGRTYEGAFDDPNNFLDSDRWFFTFDKGGGGVLMDQGVHKFTMLNWILNDEVDSAQCWLSKALPSPKKKGEDNAMIKLRYKKGAIVEVVVSSTTVHPLTNITEFHGTKGSIWEDHSLEKPLKVFSSHSEAEVQGEYFYPEVEHGAYPIYYNISARVEDMYFADCILKDKDPEFSPEDAKKAIEVVLLGYYAANLQRTVTMEEFHDYIKDNGSKAVLNGIEDKIQKNFANFNWQSRSS
ncbi:MAG: Gfo/Idh/MocA family protein [Promethearchaeota archaeon]